MTKICVLKCNTYRLKNNIQFYYQSFFGTTIKESNIFDCLENHFPSDSQLNDYELFILTGTKCIELLCYDKPLFVEKILNLISKIINKNKIIYGTCFGHQILSHFFGARIDRRCQANYWEIGIKDFSLTSPAQSLYPFQKKTKDLTMITVHHDYVKDISNTKLLPLLENSNALLITFDENNKIQTLSCQGHFLYDESFLTHHHKDLFQSIIERNNINDPSLVVDNPKLRQKYIKSQELFKLFVFHYLIAKKPMTQKQYQKITKQSFNPIEYIEGCH